MKARVFESGGHAILELESPVASVDDSVELLSACFEHRTRSVLVDHALLPPAFFELRTRFLGEFLQKLVNYRVRLALVLPPERELSERFREFLREAKRGTDFAAFTSRAEAEAFLAR
ncbi:MAG TPA: DUF4180 domain-containing protein [Myxococcota bacterium]|nr:DUF4180 domain-containing protein [Myxococcota bacterium]